MTRQKTLKFLWAQSIWESLFHSKMSHIFYKKETWFNAEPKVQEVVPKATWNHSQEQKCALTKEWQTCMQFHFRRSVDKWLWHHNVKGVKVICKMGGKLLWAEANCARVYLAITSPVLMALPTLQVLPFSYATPKLPINRWISLFSPTYEWEVQLFWQTEYSRREGILWSSRHSLVCWKHLLLVCLCLGHTPLGPHHPIIIDTIS